MSAMPWQWQLMVTISRQAVLEARDIQLDNGRVIHITEDYVPNPPVLTFAHDIARLNYIWDDTSGFWESVRCQRRAYDAHTLAGPLQPFERVTVRDAQEPGFICFVSSILNYVLGLSDDSVPQFPINFYRSKSPTDFWKESPASTGKHLSYRRIILILQGQRKNDNSSVVQWAQEYGSWFSEVFICAKNDW
jgi:hypothetical protein